MTQPYNTFLFDITNKGRTVARIMETGAEYRILPRGDDLPQTPEYQNAIPNALTAVHGHVLVPEDPVKDISYGITERIDVAKFNSILNGDLVLYVYAFIRYLDFSNVEHVIQFCYRYAHTGPSMEMGKGVELLGRWFLAGPPDYNTHT